MSPTRGFVSAQPAKTWEEGLLSGNGTIGANVLSRPHDERVIFTHERLFMPMGTPTVPQDQSAHLFELRRLIEHGLYQQATELQFHLSGQKSFLYPDNFVPAFDLTIRCSDQGQVRDYARSVDFQTGETLVRWSDDCGTFERRLFVSRADGVAVLELTGTLNLQLAREPRESSDEFNDDSDVNKSSEAAFRQYVSDIQSTATERTLTYRNRYTHAYPGSIHSTPTGAGGDPRGAKHSGAKHKGNGKTMKKSVMILCLLAVLTLSLAGTGAAGQGQADLKKPVKVFLLLGQSNMLGMGEVGPAATPGTLEYVTKTAKKYPHLIDAAGQWAVRHDVRYTFVMQNRGSMQLVQNDWLSVRGKAIGPELQLGYLLGEALEEPVLILKACIGNRSLGWDLLPPGSERFTFEGRTYAGYKDDTPSWVEGQEKKPVAWYAGKQYDDDTANAKRVLSELDKYYPGAQRYEIAGFVWWQGHKDQNAAHASRYEQNLVRLIKSLRKDFNAPKAPFVLAVGCGTPGRTGFGLQLAQAQLAMNDALKYPEFAGNVLCVESRDFWKSKDASPNPRQDYHYYRNAETYLEVGDALGKALLTLLQKKTPR